MEKYLELELPFILGKMINTQKIHASSSSFRIESVNQKKFARERRAYSQRDNAFLLV